MVAIIAVNIYSLTTWLLVLVAANLKMQHRWLDGWDDSDSDVRRKKLRLRGVKRRREQAQGAADVAATELAQTKEELERTQGVDVGV